MRLNIFHSAFAFISILLLCNQAHAESVDDKESQLMKALSMFGDGVVGKALPDLTIEDPYLFVSGKPGKYGYHITFDDNDNADRAVEIHSHFEGQDNGSRYWSVKIGEQFIEEWKSDNKGNVHLIAQTDTDSGYRVELMPHLLVPAGAKPGQQWKIKSKLSVYETSDLDTIAYQGSLLSNKIYEGRYEVTTPAGKFDAILISDEYEIEISAVSIKDRRYTFYAADVGKVAEIDGFHVSAFLLFHEEENQAKVLKSPPDVADERSD